MKQIRGCHPVEGKEDCDCLPKVVKKNPLNPVHEKHIFCTIFVYFNLLYLAMSDESKLVNMVPISSALVNSFGMAGL